MLRHSHPLQRVTLLLLALATHTWADGWSTNVWPSQQYPRASYQQLAECWTATVERCTVAGVSSPSAPSWWRSNRANLGNIKTALKSAIPNFVATNRLAASTPLANDYFATNTGSSATLPTWSVTALCASVGIPTNYFEYTPYRSLSGLGAQTNDTTVPYPYGETNATTVKGGTLFPGARTNWYTTDYGWAPLTNVFAALLWTRGTPTDNKSSIWEKYYPNYGGKSESAYYAEYSAIKTYLSNNWAVSGSPLYSDAVGNEMNIYNTIPLGRAFAHEWWATLVPIPTAYWHQVEFYAFSDPPYITGYSGHDLRTYTNWGDGLIDNQYAYFDLTTASASSNITSATMGTTNITFFNDVWATQPAYSNLYYINLLGYRRGGYRAIIRWDCSNGFTFK